MAFGRCLPLLLLGLALSILADEASSFPAASSRLKSTRLSSKIRLSGSTSSEDANNNNSDVPLPVAPWPFSRHEQSVREAELELLADLRFGDDNLHNHEFRDVWYAERGDAVERKMHSAWKSIGHPDYWPKAEKTLLELIEQDATYLHPFVLLSKLYCLQGRFEESATMCKAILKLKPYHFLALETMVANSFALKSEDAKHWEARRMPPLTRPQERLEWVKRAIADATRLLEEAKQNNEPKEEEDLSDEGIVPAGAGRGGSNDAWQ